MENKNIKLEPCNRCCSDGAKAFLEQDNPNVNNTIVICGYCGFKETLEIWQLRGWRSIFKYPPTYSGIIFIYGKEIGRTIANWDSQTQTCSNIFATHWLRTPDPRKQIDMH